MTQYMQNILDSERLYNNIKSTKHQRRAEEAKRTVDVHLIRAGNKIIENIEDFDPEKALKLLSRHEKTLASIVSSSNPDSIAPSVIINNNNTTQVPESSINAQVDMDIKKKESIEILLRENEEY